jgi:hypothetical protein
MRGRNFAPARVSWRKDHRGCWSPARLGIGGGGDSEGGPVLVTRKHKP